MRSGGSVFLMNIPRIIVIAILAVLIVASIFILVPKGPGVQGTVALPAAEVRSYQGNDLSSINDFRENSIKGPQNVNISDYRLTVTGLTNHTDVYTYDEVLAKYPRYTKVVTLFCVEGWDTTILWEGVLVRDLITTAGIDPRATTVIFTAHDGYTTSSPLDYLMDNDIIIAYRMNNVTLPAERGYPFQLVAEDKWGYKWIKWIEKIELSDNAAYKGYWEQRGYSNTADLDKSYFGN
jgi:DMSO/TMAO reductase YedYZ molybdopterin-dependent catalytic subunit